MISIELIDTPRSQPEKPFDRLQGPGSSLSGMGEIRNLEVLLIGHHQERLEASRFIMRQHGLNPTSSKSNDKCGWLKRAWCLLSSLLSQPEFDR